MGRRGLVRMPVDGRCGSAGRWRSTTTEIVRYRLPRAYTKSSHAHAHPGLAVVLSGSFRARSLGADEADRLDAGQALVLPADWPHEEDARGVGADVLLIGLTPGARLPSGGVLKGPALAARVQAIEDIVFRPSSSPDRRLSEVVRQIVELGRENDGKAPAWLQQARVRLEGVPSGAWSVREAAEEAGCSREHFSRAFRTWFGDTPARFRVRQRLRTARQRLLEDGCTVSDAAHAAGFADHSHLARAFRAEYGITPSAFQKTPPQEGAGEL